MLFLMNDAVLFLDLGALTPQVDAGRFASLPLAAVLRLGAEMFAQAPLLPRSEPERAKRLAALIVTRANGANAALFETPNVGCPPDKVTTRIAEISLELMAELYAQELRTQLTPVLADNRVWRRMAA